MNTKHKIFFAVGIVGLVLIIIVAILSFKDSPFVEQTKQLVNNQEVSVAGPVDIVLDFYNPWLEAVKSSSTNPYTSGLAAEKLLSAELRTRLMSTEGDSETEIDPVLCQTTVPEGVTGRIVVEREDEARVLVMAKDKKLSAQSVFTLKRLNGGWFISSIACSPGEFDLPREFSFDREGYLLKSVPPPLDSKLWHIVFEENDELGHAVPLFFTATSTCMSADRKEEICVPDEFVEAVKIHAYGQMSERGVEVKRLEFIVE